jgi:hypothetical protein
MDPIHNPNLISLRSILIFSHLRFGLAGIIFPSGISTKMLWAFVISIMRAKCRAHLILIDLIIIIVFGEDYNL